MSTAMMSAPSSASRIACERPWPRPAPVTKATLPATLPATDSPFPEEPAARRVPLLGAAVAGLLLEQFARVDRQRDPGDVARLVGGEPQHRVGDVHRLDPGDRQGVDRQQ